MIAILDYGVGNLFSLRSSLQQLGLQAVVTADADAIRAADRLILPGVGAFGDAMAKLTATGLVPVLKEQAEQKPLLGICLGMQLLFEKSYEYGEHAGLGFIKGEVCPLGPDLADKSLKVCLAHRKGRPPVPLHPRGRVCVLRPQLLRQKLRRKHPCRQRLFHPGHRRGAGGAGVWHPVPPGKERRYRVADPQGVQRIVSGRGR